ncbi:cyclic AMP-responsive element-binding protein 3-like protein 4 isoform X5 [Salvelinus namaycush]|uniref:Cyclic AMP-responsive element-binding protein 3-like protein 4 n=1 Tax=Salvelinus namaycush TaxID=8040 RepID=A0A8U0PZA5_SALNM|nr:cyclic AMP-responsive element-binding protein 3-like protein 4 isoform X5 [Salvelinus namaycush]
MIEDMDVENGELFFGHKEDSMTEESWGLEGPFSCSDVIYAGSEKPLDECTVDPQSGLNDSEPEDVLYAINPNDVFPTRAPVETSSESDSGISEEPCSESPLAATVDPSQASTTIYQLYPDLTLTEEEQKLLNQEGISLPNNMPLTKVRHTRTAEERILKKVRRKIRNKQSAQDSRRRKKDYVDGLESRAAACSAQNKELQRTVEQLEKHNMSLLAQLRRLQSLIKQTVTKAAQTSTCVMIILFSLGLIIFPSYSPFNWGASSIEEDYTPKGVISRNILTDPASSLQASEDVDNHIIQPDSPPVSRDLSQSDPPDASRILKQPIESPEITDIEGVALEESQPGNSSTLVDGQTEPLALGLVSATGKGSTSLDPTKPAHADEM